MTAYVQVRIRAKNKAGSTADLLFSRRVGGEEDDPVYLTTPDGEYGISKEDLLAFARAISGTSK